MTSLVGSSPSSLLRSGSVSAKELESEFIFILGDRLLRRVSIPPLRVNTKGLSKVIMKKRTPQKLLQEAAEKELWKGMSQHFNHFMLSASLCDLNAPSTWWLFFPDKDSLGWLKEWGTYLGPCVCWVQQHTQVFLLLPPYLWTTPRGAFMQMVLEL